MSLNNVIIAWYDDLLPVHHQALAWTSNDNWFLWTNSIDSLVAIQRVSSKKCIWTCRLHTVVICPGLNESLLRLGLHNTITLYKMKLFHSDFKRQDCDSTLPQGNFLRLNATCRWPSLFSVFHLALNPGGYIHVKETMGSIPIPFSTATLTRHRLTYIQVIKEETNNLTHYTKS